MSNNHPTFVEAVLAGTAFDTDIDDFIDQWHSSESTESLAKFLGFTDEEYALWVEQPAVLRTILTAKRYGADLDSTIKWDDAHLIAARSMSSQESEILLNWLKREGHLD